MKRHATRPLALVGSHGRSGLRCAVIRPSTSISSDELIAPLLSGAQRQTREIRTSARCTALSKPPSPTEGITRYEALLPLLRAPLNTEEILRLLPSILAALHLRSTDHARRLLRAFVPHIARRRMIVLVPLLAEHMMVRVDETVERGLEMNGPLRAESLFRLYDSFFYRLGFFLERPAAAAPAANAGTGTGENGKETEEKKGKERAKGAFEDGALPLPIRRTVLALTQHLIDTLARLPSTSALTTQHHLPRSLINRLMSRRYLTPELRRLLLTQCRIHSIDISAEWWRHCILSAVEEGNAEDAMVYRKEKAAAEKRLAAIGHDAHHSMADQVLSPKLGASPARDQSVTKTIEELLLAQGGKQSDFLRTIEQHLHPPGNPSNPLSTASHDGPYHYAWSMLLAREAADRSVDVKALLEMASAMPGTAIIGHTLTPVMHGLVKRGEAMRAWEIWRDLVERERTAVPAQRGLYVDRITLAVATEACYAASSLDAALTLVDSRALRPWMSQADSHLLVLDPQNINVLLTLCKRDGRPSIAFRLWAAALPRYGVYLDDISLNLLLDTARFADLNHETDAPEDMFRSRLRQMAEEFGLRHNSTSGKTGTSVDAYDAYDAAGFAKGSAAVLLDPPEYNWRRDHGSAKPWQMAREVFRQVIFGNWPFLQGIKSPLETLHSAFSFSSIFGSATSTSVYASANASENNIKTRQLPSPEARYTHIIPTSTTFKSYIALLGYYNLHAEIPLALGWMKALAIEPSWDTMCLALMHICEGEGPRRWIRDWTENGESALVRDEEVVRRWLESWLGDEPGAVPTEEDVAARRRWLAAKRQRLTA